MLVTARAWPRFGSSEDGKAIEDEDEEDEENDEEEEENTRGEVSAAFTSHDSWLRIEKGYLNACVAEALATVDQRDISGRAIRRVTALRAEGSTF